LNKEMHGKFFRDVNEFACTRTYEWVKSGYVNKSTEGFIFAAQDFEFSSYSNHVRIKYFRIF